MFSNFDPGRGGNDEGSGDPYGDTTPDNSNDDPYNHVYDDDESPQAANPFGVPISESDLDAVETGIMITLALIIVGGIVDAT